MPYPESPFDNSFNTEYLLNGIISHRNDTQCENLNLNNYLNWLCSIPKLSSIRVNTLKNHVSDVFKNLETYVNEVSTICGKHNSKVELHKYLNDTIIIHNWNVDEDLVKHDKEVIVDNVCAEAVLRGAHIFAPGVLGMTAGIKLNETLSIYADLKRSCKKGYQKLFEGEKVFLGNGIAKMIRCDIFKEHNPRGIAIEVRETISGCPPLGREIFDNGIALLQNIPSIVCIHNLNPQPGETILDMCASPGNKTTHIAAKMKNEGCLLAIDKTPKKIAQLQKTCCKFNANVHIYQADSTKILSEKNEQSSGPPFPKEMFDKILLDAPCSALGKRPQLRNTITEKELKSYVPLQRKLIETAVQLLKVNGTLVYSTCTITTAENEGIVYFALKKFPYLQLKKAEPFIGCPGLPYGELTQEQYNKLQRFGPDDKTDSVGFFIATFVKNEG